MALLIRLIMALFTRPKIGLFHPTLTMLPATHIYYFRRAIYNAIYNAETGCGSCISAADFYISIILFQFREKRPEKL